MDKRVREGALNLKSLESAYNAPLAEYLPHGEKYNERQVIWVYAVFPNPVESRGDGLMSLSTIVVLIHRWARDHHSGQAKAQFRSASTVD